MALPLLLAWGELLSLSMIVSGCEGLLDAWVEGNYCNTTIMMMLLLAVDERTNRVSNGGDMKNENWLAVSVARDTIPRSSHR